MATFLCGKIEKSVNVPLARRACGQVKSQSRGECFLAWITGVASSCTGVIAGDPGVEEQVTMRMVPVCLCRAPCMLMRIINSRKQGRHASFFVNLLPAHHIITPGKSTGRRNSLTVRGEYTGFAGAG